MSVAADVRGASAQGASVRVAYVTALVTGVGGYVRGFFVWGWCQKASDRGLVFGSHLPHRELRSDKHLGIKLLLLLRTFTSRKYNITQTYRSSNQIVNTCAIRFQASSLSFSGAFNDVYHNVRFILSYINKIC